MKTETVVAPTKPGFRRYGYAGGILLCMALLCALLFSTAGATGIAGVAGAALQSMKPAPDNLSPSSCTPNWNIVSSPNNATGGSILNAVAAVSPSDIWAAGYYTDTTPTEHLLTEHWNGTAWSIVAAPEVGAADNEFYGLIALSAGDVWAVGVGNYKSLTEHWNGSAWSIVANPNNGQNAQILTSVSAVSASDIWAVGMGSSGGAGFDTLTEHWDGSTWSIVPSPSPGSADNHLYGVSAVGPNDVWAAGDAFDGSAFSSVIEHWNGSAWSVATSPSGSTGYQAIYALASNDVWAVGGGNPAHWNGSAWSAVNAPFALLRAVSGSSSTDVWAAGYIYSGSVKQTATEHWDGSTWSIVASPDQGTGNNALNAITALAPNTIWSVGDYLGSGVDQTLVEHYTGTCGGATPTSVPPGTPSATATHHASPTVTPPPAASPTPCTGFSDVPSGSTFYPYITCLVGRGVISGYSDCTFRPSNNVTRGQLSKIVALAAGYSDPAGTQRFEDVAPASPFYTYVQQLSSRGVIGGYPCGGAGEPCVAPGNRPYFRPGGTASRGQTSKIVAIAMGLPAPIAGQQTFQDVPANSPFWQWIEELSTQGAIGGYPCGGAGEPCMPPGNRPYFRPAGLVTRGQASKIVANTFFPNCSTLK